jgi:hypothetical protein
VVPNPASLRWVQNSYVNPLRRRLPERKPARRPGALSALTRGLRGLLHAREVEPERIVVERVSLPLLRLTPALDGYGVVRIGDVHLESWMMPERPG